MTLHTAFRIHLGIVFLSAYLPNASSQQGGAVGSTGNIGEPGRRVAPQRPQSPPAQSPQFGGQWTPDFVIISGNVMLENGTPPPFGTVIDMDCGGIVSREAEVGLNGRFSFQFGGNDRYSQALPDASRGFDPADSDVDRLGRANASVFPSPDQNWRDRRMAGCTLQARLNGYWSSRIRLKEEPMRGQNEIGAIVIYPWVRAQDVSVSLTTLTAPKSARKAYENALKEIRKQKFADAERMLRLAVDGHPQYAEAWYLIGALCEQRRSFEEARTSYQESVKADPAYVKPYVRLAQIAAVGKRWKEVADLSERALALNPVAFLECYFLSAVAHLNLNELEQAEKRAIEGRRMDLTLRFPQFNLVMANVYALRKDSESAVREMQDYLRIVPNAENALAVRAHLGAMVHAHAAGQ